jgi:1-acyl-sn-glycerol-3-phosphate acyltransferase
VLRTSLTFSDLAEGTRRMAVRLPFKDGAYKVALESESLLVPISIEIPHNVWNNWYPLCLFWCGSYDKVVLTVHPPVEVKKDMDREEIKKKTYDAIFSVIPLIGEEIKESKKER